MARLAQITSRARSAGTTPDDQYVRTQTPHVRGLWDRLRSNVHRGNKAPKKNPAATSYSAAGLHPHRIHLAANWNFQIPEISNG